MAFGKGEVLVMVSGVIGIMWLPPPPPQAANKQHTIDNKPENTRTLDNFIASPREVEA
ncbi:MAG TPA: hypothetical protein VFB04_17765 [Terriglobales bacterium]|nr:hypothetical protein [Terriglobales bacterium]